MPLGVHVFEGQMRGNVEVARRLAACYQKYSLSFVKTFSRGKVTIDVALARVNAGEVFRDRISSRDSSIHRDPD